MKGGHRLVVVGSAVARAVICYLLIARITSESTVFFLLALCLLVGQKSYQVARSALVPAVAAFLSRNSNGSIFSISQISSIRVSAATAVCVTQGAR